MREQHLPPPPLVVVVVVVVVEVVVEVEVDVDVEVDVLPAGQSGPDMIQNHSSCILLSPRSVSSTDCRNDVTHVSKPGTE